MRQITASALIHVRVYEECVLDQYVGPEMSQEKL